MKTEWTCTDPDNYQYGRQISIGVYEFKEFDRFNYEINLVDYPNEEIFIDTIFDNEEFWEIVTVVLKHYSEEEKEDVANCYYGSLEELKEQCGDAWEWILAECIFEQESGFY